MKLLKIIIFLSIYHYLNFILRKMKLYLYVHDYVHEKLILKKKKKWMEIINFFFILS